MIGPSIPTNFNDTAALQDFAKDLGITVGIGFVVPAIVLSGILIFIFVKYCGGGGKTRVQLEPSQRYTLLVASLIIFLICIVTCAVGWSYNNKIHDGVSDGKDTLQGVINTSSGLMRAVNDSVSDLKDQLVDEIYAKTAPIVTNISSLKVPLDNILGVIEEARVTLLGLTALTGVIVDNITIVKEDLANLAAIESDNIIHGVPSPDEIPNVDNSFTDSLNNSVNSLDGVVGNVHNMSNSVNDTLSAVNSTVTERLFTLTDDYDRNAADILTYVYDFENKIGDTNHSFNDASDEFMNLSDIRKSIVAAVLILPLVLSGLALAGALLKLKLVLKISAGLCFLFMFWYFLAAGLNFVAYYTFDQVCQNQDEIVDNALFLIDSQEINIPGTNNSVRVSEKVQLLLRCSGNQTLIDIFEFNFLIDDLTGDISGEIESLISETNQLNQTEQYHEGLNNLAAMENTSVNLDFLQNSSLPTVHQELKNLTDQVNNTINNPAYFASLQEVNDITNDLTLTNGTEVHLYYDSTNITYLDDCGAFPYDQMTSSEATDLCNKSHIAIQLTEFRNQTILRSGDVYGNVTDIDNRLYGFEASIPQIEAAQNETRQYAGEIRSYLDEAYYLAAAIIVQVQQSAADVIAVITAGTGTIVQDTQCAYLGDAYQDLTHTVCKDVTYSLKIITAMLIIGACMLFASSVVGMMTSYKIARDFPEKD